MDLPIAQIVSATQFIRALMPPGTRARRSSCNSTHSRFLFCSSPQIRQAERETALWTFFLTASLRGEAARTGAGSVAEACRRQIYRSSWATSIGQAACETALTPLRHRQCRQYAKKTSRSGTPRSRTRHITVRTSKPARHRRPELYAVKFIERDRTIFPQGRRAGA